MLSVFMVLGSAELRKQSWGGKVEILNTLEGLQYTIIV